MPDPPMPPTKPPLKAIPVQPCLLPYFHSRPCRVLPFLLPCQVLPCHHPCRVLPWLLSFTTRCAYRGNDTHETMSKEFLEHGVDKLISYLNEKRLSLKKGMS